MFPPARLAKLASDMLVNVITKNHIRHFSRHPDSFSGKQAVDWMVQSDHAKHREEAVMLGDMLFKVQFVEPILQATAFNDSRDLYRFTDLPPCKIERIFQQPAKRSGIALVAHNSMKETLLRWSMDNKEELSKHKLYATGTTGTIISNATGLQIDLVKSGPLGGDQQIGAMISEKKIDTLVFFWDPLMAQPHDNDVKALLRVAVIYNVAIAMNVNSANYLFTS